MNLPAGLHHELPGNPGSLPPRGLAGRIQVTDGAMPFEGRPDFMRAMMKPAVARLQPRMRVLAFFLHVCLNCLACRLPISGAQAAQKRMITYAL